MNDHYYTRNPESESRPATCEYVYRGVHLIFQTDAGVFSRGEVDTGTDLLLNALPEEETAEGTIQAVIAAVDGFAGDTPQFDDITMLCFTYQGARGL